MDNMMQAEISYWETTFSGNDFEIKEYEKEYRLRARQELPDDGVHYIDFWIPLSVPQHGQEVKIELLSNPVSPADPPQVRGEYSRFLAGGSGRSHAVAHSNLITTAKQNVCGAHSISRPN